MRLLVWIIAFAACLQPATRAIAVEPDPGPSGEGRTKLIQEVRFGIMAHDVGGLWSGDRKEDGVDYGAEIVFGRPLGHFWSGVILPNVGFDWHNRGDTSKAYGGLIWHWNNDRRLSFEIGLGAAVHTGERETRDDERKQLGSKLLFRIPIELGYEVAERQRVSLFFEHVSNAWLADENEGMDLLGLRWAYKF
jgi:hypothetical protein